MNKEGVSNFSYRVQCLAVYLDRFRAEARNEKSSELSPFQTAFDVISSSIFTAPFLILGLIAATIICLPFLLLLKMAPYLVLSLRGGASRHKTTMIELIFGMIS